jgi:tRNA1Val (adenine37-N6)-methyltransferase
MANSYFQFKQFRVEQDRCAMKVCTDACIQGAYTCAPNAKRILDIGCGTGLLSLMMAQRHPAAYIDAVEIEVNAYKQALENVSSSPWADRIRVQHLPVQSFSASLPYDLIIVNPPFYPRHLRSPNKQRNQAHHHDSLSFQELAKACKSLLAPEGYCSILLPPEQADEFAGIAAGEGLYASHELEIRESHSHQPHRSIRQYGQHQKSFSLDRLNIRDEDNSYSQAFRKLLQPYYTIF